MKKLTLLFIISSIISCQSNQGSENIPTNFEKGIEVLQATSIQKNDYLNALTLFEKAIEENSTHVEAKYWKSHCEINSGQFKNALNTSTAVIENNANENHKFLPGFYVKAGLAQKILGDTISSMGYFEKANEIYDNRINEDHGNINAIMNKALVLCYMNKKNEAIDFVSSVSIMESKQHLLEQVKTQVSEFDASEYINELANK